MKTLSSVLEYPNENYKLKIITKLSLLIYFTFRLSQSWSDTFQNFIRIIVYTIAEVLMVSYD